MCVTAVFCLGACGRPPAATVAPASKAHEEALHHDAVAASYLLKDPARAVAEDRLAVLAEPSNPQWKGALAFSLHKAGRTEEAIPIWRGLATSNDKEGQMAAKWLKKVGARR